jgi:hypothetical protein
MEERRKSKRKTFLRKNSSLRPLFCFQPVKGTHNTINTIIFDVTLFSPVVKLSDYVASLHGHGYKSLKSNRSNDWNVFHRYCSQGFVLKRTLRLKLHLQDTGSLDLVLCLPIHAKNARICNGVIFSSNNLQAARWIYHFKGGSFPWTSLCYTSCHLLTKRWIRSRSLWRL